MEIYEEARKRNPRDTQLAAKMGQALQKTHQYGKAINYYREAVKNQDHSRLRYDLAELLMKLKTYEKAEKAIKEALNEEAKSNDLTSLISQAKFITLLATVHEKNGDLQAATNSLNEAKQGGFQLEFVSISRVINHMTRSFKCSHWLKLQHSDWRANLAKDLKKKIYTNKSTRTYYRSCDL